MSIRTNINSKSGNLNGLPSGSVVAGNPIDVNSTPEQKIWDLSALVSVTPTTASLAAILKWQVSDDGVDWVDVANGSQNAASVVLATGPSPEVTRSLPPPQAVYGWRKARIALVTGGAAGAAGDVYSLGYCCRSH